MIGVARSSRKHDRPLRVLMSYAAPGPKANPFTSNLSEGLSREVDVRHLTMRALLWGKVDVVHLHWPENLFRASGVLRNLVKTFCGVVFLLRVQILRVPIVYTQHNVVPHERPGLAYGMLYRWIQRQVIVRIYLNESAENDPSAGVTILHGDYPQAAGAQVVRRRDTAWPTVLFFGLLRRYKGLEALFEAFAGTKDPELRLRVRGAANDQAYAIELAALAAGDDRISFHPEFIADRDLEQEIADADLVVLPYVGIYNSGAALLALSRGKAILAPAGPSIHSLQREVGPDFVRVYEPPLTAHAISSAMTGLPAATDLPDLSRRSWPTICGLHAALYEIVWRHRRRGRGSAIEQVRRDVAKDLRFVRHSFRNALVAGARNAGS